MRGRRPISVLASLLGRGLRFAAARDGPRCLQFGKRHYTVNPPNPNSSDSAAVSFRRRRFRFVGWSTRSLQPTIAGAFRTGPVSNCRIALVLIGGWPCIESVRRTRDRKQKTELLASVPTVNGHSIRQRDRRQNCALPDFGGTPTAKSLMIA